jgi:uncharacterized protein (DUF2237 family)
MLVTLLQIVGVASRNLRLLLYQSKAVQIRKAMTEARNVLGGSLQTCCTSPMTGFYRDGCCNTGAGDVGAHVVCAQVTEQFLDYTRAQGNDLSTPVPAFNFPGLKPGDRWCLCASRWKEAFDDGVAPPVVLAATHASALEYVTLDELKQHAIEVA